MGYQMEVLVLDVVKGFATDSAKTLIARIAALNGDEGAALDWTINDDLMEFQKKLTALLGMLQGTDCSKKQALEDWLKKVKAVIYQAEDLLDDYDYKVLERELLALEKPQPQSEPQPQPQPQPEPEPQQEQPRRGHDFFSCICCCHILFSRIFFSHHHRRRRPLSSVNPDDFNLQLADRVMALKDSIAEIYNKGKKLGIKPVKVAVAESSSYGNAAYADVSRTAEQQLQWRRQLVDYETMIGRDDDKRIIMELICQACNSNKLLNVVGIHGMAGIGKTTLCRNIFKTKQVEECFDERIWICVSRDFDLTRLLNEMVEQIQGETTSTIEAITNNLQEELKGKKYLLVLDDVWETFIEVWHSLKSSLEKIGGLKGTTILVTSRRRDVLEKLQTKKIDPAEDMDDPFVYQLEGLKDDKSVKLLKKIVGSDLSHSGKLSIGETMLEKCRGVPLAIRTLGGLLCSRKRVEEWEEIAASEIWITEDFRILPSIRLSFKYLPDVSIQKCFAYCGIFAENEVIKKDRVIQLWMAHGLLQPFEKMEEVGEEYVGILLNHSLFQDAEFDHEVGKLIGFKMHDVVHTLARDLLGSELCVSTNGAKDVYNDEVRHLWIDSKGLFPEEQLGSNLRTLFSSIDITRNIVFMVNMKYLRVLSLIDVGLEELPGSIGELKHLRYLDISENKISTLPNGLTKLPNLQTIRCFKASRFPMVPQEFSKLVNLRHLSADEYCRMGIPNALGKLSCLRTLPTLDLTQNWGGSISELETLSNLKGTLTIKGLEEVTIEEARNANLGRKENIDVLVLEWSLRSKIDLENDKMVLEILQPNSNLTALTIKRYRPQRLPEWLVEMTAYGGSLFSNLEYLTFAFIKTLEPLPSLKNLAALKQLNIIGCGGQISPLDLSGLISLEELVIFHCTKMENLVDITQPLPHLQKITIQHCLKMTALPAGLSNNLPSLRELKVGPFCAEFYFFPFLIDITDDISPLSRSLEVLELNGGEALMDKVTSLPDQIQYLVALKNLTVERFNGLKALPEWLGKLTSLQELKLCWMPNLEDIPSEDAMRNLIQLRKLDINNCPLLEARCHKETGSEWSKIQHIPRIFIGGQNVQDIGCRIMMTEEIENPTADWSTRSPEPSPSQ